MPISYGNAFGGIDQLPGDEPRYEYFADNPVGIGFHKHLESGLVAAGFRRCPIRKRAGRKS